MLERDGRDKVLIVLHQDHSTPGRVGALLAQRGFALDIRRPSLGEPLPATLAEHAGAIVFGGPMSANDELDWVRREIDWLAVPLGEDKPLLGVCLGAQMLARQLGARVFTYPDKRSEIGYYPLTPTPDADRLCAAPFPRHVYHWHCDGFELPRGARLLAAQRRRIPQSGLRLRVARAGAAVPPGSHLRDDLPLDDARRRAARTARRAAAVRTSRGLVPLRSRRRAVARGDAAGLARRRARSRRNARADAARARAARPLGAAAPTLEVGASQAAASPR